MATISTRFSVSEATWFAAGARCVMRHLDDDAGQVSRAQLAGERDVACAQLDAVEAVLARWRESDEDRPLVVSARELEAAMHASVHLHPFDGGDEQGPAQPLT